MTDLELGSFLKLLAHDLQNQLGVVDLNLQIIPDLISGDDPTFKAIAPFLKRASSGAADLNEMLLDLQVFTQILGTKSFRLADVNISDQVRACADELAGAAKDRQIAFRVTAPENVHVLGAAELIARALKSLVADTLRSSPAESIVTVNCLSGVTPTIEITSTQEGLFDAGRPNLVRFLAERLLVTSGATVVSSLKSPVSGLKVVWKTSQM